MIFNTNDTKVLSKETLHGYDRGLCILQFCASGSSIMILAAMASSGDFYFFYFIGPALVVQ